MPHDFSAEFLAHVLLFPITDPDFVDTLRPNMTFKSRLLLHRKEVSSFFPRHPCPYAAAAAAPPLFLHGRDPFLK